MIKKQIYLPFFTGFYESIHDYDYEYLRDDLQEYYGKTEKEAENILSDFDFNKYKNDYSKEYYSNFKDEYGDLLKLYGIELLDFKGVNSPREYNFSTDEIEIEVNIDYDRLNKNIYNLDLVKLKKLIKDRCTSYDGFFSWTSNDFNEWMGDIKEKNLSSGQVTLLIEFICKENYNCENIDLNLMYKTKEYICDGDYLPAFKILKVEQSEQG